MFAAMVWGKETKQPGFVEKLTLWMRQVFPSSMWYPNKYILISQEVMLALSSSASVIQAARSWQILKLGKASKIIPQSWSGCLFGIWRGFNKLSCKKWKPQAVVGRGWQGREAERKALGVLVLLWSWELLTGKAAQPGCSGTKPELKPSFSAWLLSSRSAEGIQLFYSVQSEPVSSCSLRCGP